MARQVRRFKRFLLRTELQYPLWYQLADLYLTLLGAFCFYMDVVEPGVAGRYGLMQVEDVVNVNFLVRFLLLFWAHEFDVDWLFEGKALLDLASCLPVLGIPARSFGGAMAQNAVDLLQLARFLRLLKMSLPSAKRAAGDQEQEVFQAGIVFLALSGTIAVSATLLYFYEGWGFTPVVDGGGGSGGSSGRSFEDALLYMVTVFVGRDTPFLALTPGGKQVTVAATLVGVLFVPFLISETLFVFGGMQPAKGAAKASPTQIPAPAPNPPALPAERPDVAYWAQALSRMDLLEALQLLTEAEARELRRRCLLREAQLQILDVRYGAACSLDFCEQACWELYARRLREWLRDSGFPPRERR